MQHPTDQATRLLALAKRDTTSFMALASHPEVDISATGFFAQQVVEKCLKAVATRHGIVFRRTHDVDELVDLLLQHQVPMPFPPDQFSVLNPFAVILRYEEVPLVSMTVATMVDLVELAYQWATTEMRDV
jgi:HEPN domain-containing protein